MSDWSEKFEQVRRHLPGKARATASQIRLMSGELTESKDRIVRVGMFGNRQVWLRVAGNGVNATYELQQEE